MRWAHQWTDRSYAREQNRPPVRRRRCPVITAADIRLRDAEPPVQDGPDRRPHLLADTPRRIP